MVVIFGCFTCLFNSTLNGNDLAKGGLYSKFFHLGLGNGCLVLAFAGSFVLFFVLYESKIVLPFELSNSGVYSLFQFTAFGHLFLKKSNSRIVFLSHFAFMDALVFVLRKITHQSSSFTAAGGGSNAKDGSSFTR